MARLPSSFRDPSGFVFSRDGILYRQINREYAPYFKLLNDSGLYTDLTARGWLIPHAVVDQPPADPERALLVIRPDVVPFISHPYEWCFSQWKDAALLTLDIQEQALNRGMTLKDASVFNLQFRNGRPVFIDTLSFETLDESAPGWIAYRQFCEHFLAPLSLMAFRDERLGRLLQLHPDGVPLDLACRLLPVRALLNFHRWVHLRVHAWGQKRSENASANPRKPVSLRTRLALVDSLRSAVRSLKWNVPKTAWSDYYAKSESYDAATRQAKESEIAALLQRLKPTTVWDLGSNTGVYSRLPADAGATTVIAADSDAACVELLYRELSAKGATKILPLCIDLANPSPAIGWMNRERDSLVQRGPADVVLALAVMHHLAIGANVSFELMAKFFNEIARSLVIEFVPKDDPMTQRLLASRKDIFADYDAPHFEEAFLRYFELRERRPLPGSNRLLYWFERRNRATAGPS